MRAEVQTICGEMAHRELRFYKRHMRQRKQRLRKCLVFLMTVCLVILCAVSYHSLETSANTGKEAIAFKYYTNIYVKHGDTLWDIAGEYMEQEMYTDKNAYIAEVCSINHLDEDGTVKSGQSLIVPYYSTAFH